MNYEWQMELSPLRRTPSVALRAVLTTAGRELLDCYLSVTSDLQIGAHH